MMQTYDVNVMISNPFDYTKFSRVSQIIKRLSICALASLIVSSDKLFHIIFLNSRNSSEGVFDTDALIAQISARHKIDIVSLIKFILFKIIYTGIIIKMTWETKKCLNESARMAGDKARLVVYHRLFWFSVLPLCLNLILIFPEALTEVYSSDLEMHDRDCVSKNVLLQLDVRKSVMTVMVTICPLSYIVAYSVLYPNVKNALSCWGQQEDQGNQEF